MVDYTLALPPFDTAFVDELQALTAQVFGRCKREKLEWRLIHMPDPSVQVARTSRLVGFKIGYAAAPQRYYSWLGGIAEGHRRQGIALGLMRDQHDWARTQAYHHIETGVLHNNSAMLSLNLKAGFRVTGTYTRTSEPTFTMMKEL